MTCWTSCWTSPYAPTQLCSVMRLDLAVTIRRIARSKLYTCIASDKLPVMELEWLYYKRGKVGENLCMEMWEADWVKTEIEVKAVKNKSAKNEAKVKQAVKKKKEKESEIEGQEQARSFFVENVVDDANNIVEESVDQQEFVIRPVVR